VVRQLVVSLFLQQRLREAIGGHIGASREVPDSQSADLAGGGQIGIEQRRRHRQHAGVVVEPIRGVVAGEPGGHIDVEREQVADGMLILGTIQPVEGRRTTRVRVGRSRLVQSTLERSNQVDVGRFIGSLGADRWHRAGLQFSQYLFPHLGIGARVGRVDPVQREPGREASVVVTAHAVLVEQCLLARHRGLGLTTRRRRSGFGRDRMGQRQRPGHSRTDRVPPGPSRQPPPSLHASLLSVSDRI
jgi:hypothetical protein